MYKVLWASRHPMTETQLKDLANWMEVAPSVIEVVTENLLWQATEDNNSDYLAAEALWKRLFHKYEIVCGVFPPVSIRALHNNPAPHPVLSPVSRQDKKTREDGSTQIEFVHLRWEPLV